MSNAVFENCKLLGIQWTSLTSLMSPTFKESSLAYSNFSGLKLKKNKFLNCQLLDVEFSLADISECDFSGSNFLNARFHETNLSKSDFRNATNYQIDPTANRVKGAQFSLPDAIGLLTGLGVVIKD